MELNGDDSSVDDIIRRTNKCTLGNYSGRM